MLQVHIITIFPEMFAPVFGVSMLKRAQERNIAEIKLHNLRKWTSDNHHSVDDKPFGGGPGMVMLVEPIYLALKEIQAEIKSDKVKVILTSAKGQKYNQQKAVDYSKLDALIIICGHYEGVDERVALHLADEEVSIGDYVLTGGELPAMVITDSVIRLIEGVLGNNESLAVESHGDEIVHEAPQYTRPAEFKDENGEIWAVPGVLLNGDHAKIAEWRKQNSQIKD
jgi:tRNA (guanine37-N1)-methyltransferase